MRERKYNLDEKAQKELIGHESQVIGLSFSPDGRSLDSGDMAGIAKVWNVRTGRILCDLGRHERPIRHIEFSPSVRYLGYSVAHEPFVVHDLNAIQAAN